jgi:hypothetical protein
MAIRRTLLGPVSNKSEFMALWTSRIGSQAAMYMYRLQVCLIIPNLTIFVVCTFTITTHKAYLAELVPAGLVFVTFGVGYFVYLARLARALSTHFGKKITVNNLPPRREDRFGEWHAKNFPNGGRIKTA